MPAPRRRSSFSRRSFSRSEVSRSGVSGSLIARRAYRALGRLDLGDLELALGTARDVDRDHVVSLVAHQRHADRRLVGELVLGGVGFRRADDLELLRVPGLLVL